MVIPMPACAVCGAAQYADRAVIWDALAEGWGLTPEERRLVDRQQGTTCTSCGGNLRSIALAQAILGACGAAGTLEAYVGSLKAASLRLLEINEAGSLSPTLRRLPGHVFGSYPDVDMQAMSFGDGTFHLIVHSDTLEHVPDPLKALKECARVLRPEGALCFTVPVLPGRLSVDRGSLPAIYHGDPATQTEDLRVHTDFGADIWDYVHRAGFATATLTRFGDGLAITARKQAQPTTQQVFDNDSAAALAAVHASASWKVTAPLRTFLSATRRLLGRD